MISVFPPFLVYFASFCFYRFWSNLKWDRGHEFDKAMDSGKQTLVFLLFEYVQLAANAKPAVVLIISIRRLVL